MRTYCTFVEKHLRLINALVWVMVITTGFFSASFHFQHKGSGNFYQAFFYPAVSLACGGPLLDQDPAAHTGMPPEKSEEIAAFLNQKSDSLSCEGVLPGTKDLGFFQSNNSLLMYLSGLVWKFTGISWNSLHILSGFFSMLGAIGMYGFAKRMMPASLAFAATIAFLLSPQHLAYTSQLRDYAKIAFFFPSLWAITCLLFAKTSRTAIVAGALSGVLIGAGTHIKPDILLALPFFFGVLVFTKNSRKTRVQAAFAFLICLWLFSPAYLKDDSGSNISHVILLGRTSTYDTPLGFDQTAYDYGRLYSDIYVATLVMDHAYRRMPEPLNQSLRSKEYDFAAWSLIAMNLLYLPADELLRGYGAALGSLSAPFLETYKNDSKMLVFKALLLFTFIGLFALDLRKGIYLFCIILYFGAGMALQYHPRHYFYMGFFGWMAAGCALFVAYEALKKLRELHGKKKTLGGAWLLRPVGSLAGLLLTLYVALFATRLYQQHMMAQLANLYETTPQKPVSYDVREENGRLAYTISDPATFFPSREGQQIETAYVAVSIDPAKCEKPFKLLTTYKTDKKAFDFSNTYTPPEILAQRPFFFLQPVFRLTRNGIQTSSFSGFSVGGVNHDCIQSIKTLNNIETLPLLLHYAYAEDGIKDDLFHRLK